MSKGARNRKIRIQARMVDPTHAHALARKMRRNRKHGRAVSSGTPGLKDRRFNDDPTEFYGRMAAVRATKENGKVNCNPSWQKL